MRTLTCEQSLIFAGGKFANEVQSSVLTPKLMAGKGGITGGVESASFTVCKQDQGLPAPVGAHQSKILHSRKIFTEEPHEAKVSSLASDNSPQASQTVSLSAKVLPSNMIVG